MSGQTRQERCNCRQAHCKVQNIDGFKDRKTQESQNSKLEIPNTASALKYHKAAFILVDVDSGSDPIPPPQTLTVGFIGCDTSLLTPHDPNPWLNATYLVSLKSESRIRELRRIFARLETSGSINFKLLHMQNIKFAERSRLVILAVRPGSIETILSKQGMAEALKGKTLISLASGVTTSQIAAAMYPNDDVKERCSIFRATPNTAASVGASATILGVPFPDLLSKSEPLRMANLFLGLIGNTSIVPESQMDAASVVCGGTPALLALFCDTIMDGAVAGGLPRNMAETMTSQALWSTAELLDEWTRPRRVREKVDWNPETTIKALLDILKGGVRDSIAQAVRDAILASRSPEEKDG